MDPLVVCISGASGIALSVAALKKLVLLGQTIHLVMTRDASYTAYHEVGEAWSSPQKIVESLGEKAQDLIQVWTPRDFSAPFASGSYRTKGVLVLPCSMASLAAVAMGLSDNLLRRAVDVALKERRPCVLVPREAPLSLIHIENMKRFAAAGGIVHPPVPCWYALAKTMEEMEDYIVCRILDSFDIDSHTYPRWGKGLEDKKGPGNLRD